MSDFKAKMHQNPNSAGPPPQTTLGNLQRSPDPIAGFKGPISKGRGTGVKGRGREWRVWEGREGTGVLWSPKKSLK